MFQTQIYTDGSCLGNPGPAGVGVILINGNSKKEITLPIGHGTNNIAEISAVVTALEALHRRERHEVKLFTDSQLVVGLLFLGWKAKANIELVKHMRDLASSCKSITVTRVNKSNKLLERCDELAKLGAGRA